MIRCEGYRQHGGAFTLGPVTWVQCAEDAEFMLTIKQNGKTQKLPACVKCWHECIKNKIEILEKARTIKPEKEPKP